MGLERFSAAWRESYVSGAFSGEHDRDESSCVFCRLASEPVGESSGVLWRSDHTYLILNAFPYGSGHLLSVPYRHVENLDDLSDEEYGDLTGVLRRAVRALGAAYHPEGMNVGMNLGSAGGAGIPKHLHAHSLPRWNGDTNFMTTIGETRVLSESLEATWRKVHPHLGSESY
ncbi:MAG TPA: HIT domain-containing protein [Acidimicrobiales bacterium]